MKDLIIKVLKETKVTRQKWNGDVVTIPFEWPLDVDVEGIAEDIANSINAELTKKFKSQESFVQEIKELKTKAGEFKDVLFLDAILTIASKHWVSSGGIEIVE
jgi:hypothetical protein